MYREIWLTLRLHIPIYYALEGCSITMDVKHVFWQASLTSHYYVWSPQPRNRYQGIQETLRPGRIQSGQDGAVKDGLTAVRDELNIGGLLGNSYWRTVDSAPEP